MPAARRPRYAVYDLTKRIVKSPICIYESHCGAKAVMGTPTRTPGDECVQRSITCIRCGRTGVESTNLVHAHDSGKGVKLSGIVLPASFKR